MELTKEQVRYFDTFGFIKLPQLFVNDLNWLNNQFRLTFENYKISTHTGGIGGVYIVQFIDQFLYKLMDDPRILGIGNSLLGEDFNYMGSDGNYYSGDTPWHRDGLHQKYTYLKIAFYLDKLDSDSGALRVIPGSHHLNDNYSIALQKTVPKSDDSFSISGNLIPAQALDILPGDILVFNHNIFHASFGGQSNRRMFTINLCQRYQEKDIQEFQDYIATLSRFSIDRIYSETMMKTASTNRMKHLEQGMKNDSQLTILKTQNKI